MEPKTGATLTSLTVTVIVSLSERAPSLTHARRRCRRPDLDLGRRPGEDAARP